MKVFTSIELVGNVNEVLVRIDGMSPAESEAIARFGEPTIDAGGSITGSATRPGDDDPTEVTLTLPSKVVRVPSEFPIKEVFSFDDTDDADVRAEVWRTTMVTRVTAAKTSVIAQAANFVGETLATV